MPPSFPGKRKRSLSKFPLGGTFPTAPLIRRRIDCPFAGGLWKRSIIVVVVGDDGSDAKFICLPSACTLRKTRMFPEQPVQGRASEGGSRRGFSSGRPRLNSFQFASPGEDVAKPKAWVNRCNQGGLRKGWLIRAGSVPCERSLFSSVSLKESCNVGMG